MQMPRRRFLGTASGAVAAAATLGCLDQCASAEPKMIPIIDTHQHLWDLSKLRLGWLNGAPEVLRRSYVTRDYLEATAGLNVVQAVYMEVDVAVDQQVAEAEHVLDLSASDDHPTAGAVISGRPNDPGFEAYVRRFAANPRMKGVRQVLHTEAPRGLCLEKQFVASVRLLGQLGKSFDLCQRPAELSDGAKLARACPETRIIVDHCGNADPKAFLDDPPEKPWHTVDQWKRDMHALASLENVVCKISGIVARVPGPDWTPEMLAPIVHFCWDAFGPDRVVFGGDWPVCLLGSSYRGWVEALRDIVRDRPEAEQRKLLHDNAVRIYGLRG